MSADNDTNEHIADDETFPGRPLGGMVATNQPPSLSPRIRQFYVPICASRPTGADLIYRPMLFGCALIYYRDINFDVDTTIEVSLLTPIKMDAVAVDWRHAEEVSIRDADLVRFAAEGQCFFGSLASDAAIPDSYASWRKDFADYLYRTHYLSIYKAHGMGEFSRQGESESQFRSRLQQAAREDRDQRPEQLRQKFAPKFAALDERVRKAMEVIREKDVISSQVNPDKFAAFNERVRKAMEVIMEKGVIGAQLIPEAFPSLKGAAKSMKDAAEIAQAKESLQELIRQKAFLVEEFEKRLGELSEVVDPMKVELAEFRIKPKKTNINARIVALVWVPYWRDRAGEITSAWK